MKKLLMLAIAAMAFAIPASASATAPVFTHNGVAIQAPETKTVTFEGAAAFILPKLEGPPGVHCKKVQANVILKSGSTGTVESFNTFLDNETQCTSTPDNLVAHTEATGLPWVVHTVTGEPDTLLITDVDIHNRLTHPMTACVIAERRLTGDFHATIPAGQTTNISHLTLSGKGIVHAGPNELEAEVSGTVVKNGSTQVGVQ